MISAAASGSAAARSWPAIRENSSSASGPGSVSRSTNPVLTRYGALLRVVTMTAHEALPGNSGPT
jgi:hypothetical protein